MRDYQLIISQVLEALGKPFKFIADGNSEIDSKLSGKTITWYPTYLVISEGVFYMFRPFAQENFIDGDEIKNECENANYLVLSLKEAGIKSKVFFITNTIGDVEVIEKQNLSDDFGILHNELENPMLDFAIINTFGLKCKLLYSGLEYLSNCKNLKGKIGEEIRIFSRAYLKEKPIGDVELDMIKKFISVLLTCDDRFKLTSDPIDFMANIERIISNTTNNTREHYFHTLNTMILGFIVIDKFYDTFEKLVKKYGNDIVLEFIWVLTSLYHDIGHPASRQYSLICESHGLELENNLVLIEECLQETRNKIWDSADYCFIVEVLNDLFNHIYNDVTGEWIFDGFARSITQTKFKDSLKISFIEKGAHGTTGALILALLTNQHIRNITASKDRQFLYRHILIASISILFHDSKVRDYFRRNSISQIKAEKFLLSLLLTYVDIVQDDRRDMTGSSIRPDIFKDIDVKDGKILAILDRSVLTPNLCKKLLDELEEALSFFVMNGISFMIPQELSI